MSEGRSQADVARSLSPWVWSQHWLDVLFLHWRVAPAEMREHIPPPLDLDTYDGDAWVSLVVFRLRVRPRGLPFLPGLCQLLEANLRTYVQLRGRPGIWFLDVLADNRFAIRAARLLTPMPYTRAGFAYSRQREEFTIQIERAADRRDRNCAAASFAASFGAGCEQPVFDGTLGSWLLERYRLYLAGRRRLLCADVVHPPWPVRQVELTQFRNTVGRSAGLDLSRPPDAIHYSPGVRALFGPFQPIELLESHSPAISKG
jgi:uncharacterized protein YqjF (DUF2071 family)